MCRGIPWRLALTAGIALVTGHVAGHILAAWGRRAIAYVDDEEIIVEENAAEREPEELVV